MCAVLCLKMLYLNQAWVFQTAHHADPKLWSERGFCDVGCCSPVALFHTWSLILGFLLPRRQVLFCFILQGILLPDADGWLIGNISVWWMFLCQIVPLCFLHKVHEPKYEITIKSPYFQHMILLVTQHDVLILNSDKLQQEYCQHQYPWVKVCKLFRS